MSPFLSLNRIRLGARAQISAHKMRGALKNRRLTLTPVIEPVILGLPGSSGMHQKEVCLPGFLCNNPLLLAHDFLCVSSAQISVDSKIYYGMCARFDAEHHARNVFAECGLIGVSGMRCFYKSCVALLFSVWADVVLFD